MQVRFLPRAQKNARKRIFCALAEANGKGLPALSTGRQAVGRGRGNGSLPIGRQVSPLRSSSAIWRREFLRREIPSVMTSRSFRPLLYGHFMGNNRNTSRNVAPGLQFQGWGRVGPCASCYSAYHFDHPAFDLTHTKPLCRLLRYQKAFSAP